MHNAPLQNYSSDTVITGLFLNNAKFLNENNVNFFVNIL